jgi:hypothetical protein
MIALPALEGVLDASGIAPRTEALLPSGARKRQLTVRTLLLGMMLALADGRPAHLTRVCQALASLPGGEQRRLGVLADWKGRPHPLTYRQAEYTFSLVKAALGKDQPDGLPSPALQAACDGLLEASIPQESRDAGSSLAVDWSDLETFSRPPPRGTGDCAGPEASWGHRKNNLRHDEDELFFGYYLPAAIMVPGEQGPPVPELARRMTLSSCRHDPVPAFTPVLTAMPQAGIPLGDILADSGYAHRIPGNWASPLRRAGAALIQDLHPHDRGPRGTSQGAIVANGNLYCPATPRTLLELGPLARSATPEQAVRHDAKTAEAAPWRTASSAASPATTKTAATGSSAPPPRERSAARCARHRWPWTGTAPRSSPRHSTPWPAAPSRPSPSRPACSPRPRRNTTTPPLPGARTYARRSGAERGFATAKDPATSTISRGWCRLTGLAPLMLFTTALLAVRNHRILAAWNARQDENGRRAAKGLPPKTRRRRRKNPAMSAAAPPRQPPSPAPPPRSPAPHGGASIPSHARQKPRTAEKAPTAPWNQPGPGQDHHPARNFRPKRENDPHPNVKTSLVELRGFEPLTSCMPCLADSSDDVSLGRVAAAQEDIGV